MSDNQNVSSTVNFSDESFVKNGIKKHLEELQRLVLDDEKLRYLKNDDKYLLRFLYSTSLDVSGAFKRMQNYHKLLAENPDWFATVSPLNKQSKIEENSKTILPGCDRNGRRIFVFKIENLNLTRIHIPEEAQLIEIYLEPVMEQPELLETEICVILDMKRFSWKLLKFFTLSNIKTAAKKLELYPLRKVIIHVVNTSFLMNTVISLVWPFLNEKIKELAQFHFENWPSLHEHINPEVLPSEYGGTGFDINFEAFQQFLYSNSDEIEKKLKFRNNIAHKGN